MKTGQLDKLRTDRSRLGSALIVRCWKRQGVAIELFLAFLLVLIGLTSYRKVLRYPDLLNRQRADTRLDYKRRGWQRWFDSSDIVDKSSLVVTSRKRELIIYRSNYRQIYQLAECGSSEASITGREMGKVMSC